MHYYKVFTDASCATNPGPAGYAALLLHDNKRNIIKGYIGYSSVNRAELTAVIKALEHCKRKSFVKVFADSQYVVNAYNNGLIREWMKNGWKRIKQGDAIQNADLWHMLIEIINDRKLFVEFIKVKAHHKSFYNNLVDKIARQQAFKFQP